jgi:DtxR family Mn-dependent transcriptional regulator
VLDSLTLLSTTATPEGRPVVIRRISEQLQENTDLLRELAQHDVRPGATMMARLVEGTVTLDGQPLPAGVAQHLFVSAVDEDLTPLEAAPLL